MCSFIHSPVLDAEYYRTNKSDMVHPLGNLQSSRANMIWQSEVRLVPNRDEWGLWKPVTSGAHSLEAREGLPEKVVFPEEWGGISQANLILSPWGHEWLT